MVAGSTGTMSMSGSPVTSIPPTWMERWRGKLRTWLQSAVNCRQGALPAEREGESTPPRCSNPAWATTSSIDSGNQESTDLASLSTTSGGKPSALPTCRAAIRGWKVTTLQTIPVRSQPYLS